MGLSPYRHFSKEGLSVHPNPYSSNRQRAKREGGEKPSLKRRLLQSDHQESRKSLPCCLIFTSRYGGGEGAACMCMWECLGSEGNHKTR
ncbi:hypothetical protein SESBI_18312 [Sesbania bispinosa]|nr:hypothetical protein SESBI_18312 [Sesbania bispinosa]